MKTNKKFAHAFGIMLCIALVLSACTNSGGNNQSSSATAEPSPSNAETSEPASTAFELGSEPLHFSFYAHYDWWNNEQWGSDPSSKWIKENLNVTVDPIQSGGAAVQKLSTMMVADELPDVLLIERADVEKLREADKLVALDDYLDKYPNLVKWAGKETLDLLRSPDGKLYMFPNWYTSRPNGNAGYAINKKIHKELGSPKLETFDDLYAYLKLVKEKYPKVIPLEVDTQAQGIEMMTSGMKEGFSPAFITNQKASDQDGMMTSIYQEPAFVDTMKYASKLFREKLITQDALTQKTEQVKEKLNNGQVAVFASIQVTSTDMREAHNLLKQADPEAGYEVIWPIHKEGVGADKVFPNSYITLGWNVNIITKGAENPEGIFAYLDWLTGIEGQNTMTYGPKGRYWDETDADGYPIFNATWDSTPQADKDKDKLGSWNWAGNTAYVDDRSALVDMSLPEDQRDWTKVQQVNVTWKTSQDGTIYYNLHPAPDSEEGIIKTTLDDMYKEYIAKALFAKSDEEVEKILNEAHEASMSQGYDKLLAFKNNQLQANENLLKTN